ncbi:MAG: dihydroorotate dehydrogenase, partial [Desulfobulbaceae bacterium]|nr:dihydroorotate dehydrogenase [Desulfobulbaceae bacterium]
HRLGGIIVKGISLEPRPGNPPPRIAETPCGMLNAIGLENVGVERFITDKLPFLKDIGSKIIVNILGDSVEDYRRLAARLSEVEGIDALEVNISCPNVKKGGVAFGTDPDMAQTVTAAVVGETSLPVIVKLSPNVTDITLIAEAVEAGGAHAVSLINTLLGMAIDIHSRRPKLGNVMGGLSGPAIRPVAVRMVYQVAGKVSIPIIGIGGIATAQDALEFIMAGASAVQIGTANFYNPGAGEELIDGLKDFLVSKNEKSVTDLIGAARIGAKQR